jgi:hypothetical protein
MEEEKKNSFSHSLLIYTKKALAPLKLNLATSYTRKNNTSTYMFPSSLYLHATINKDQPPRYYQQLLSRPHTKFPS